MKSAVLIKLLLLTAIFYGQSFKLNSQNLLKTYESYQASLKSNDLAKTITYLKKIERRAVNKGYYLSRIIHFSYLTNDSITFINSIKRIDKVDSSEIENILRSNFSRYPNWKDELPTPEISKEINQKVAIELEQLYENETLHRSKINSFYQQLQEQIISYEQFKHITDSIFKLQHPIDSVNHIRYRKLIDSLGYIPGCNELTIQQTKIHYILLQHFDNDKYKKKYVRLFKKGVKKGTLSANHYTQIIDRYKAAVGKKLLFGQSVKIDSDGKKVINGKLPSIRKLNRNRIKYGLGIIPSPKSITN